MQKLDILTLRNWYRTPTGHMVRRHVQDAISNLWPSLHGKRILVVGYGIPYVKLWLKEAQVFCALPARMGAMPWPNHAPNKCLLSWEHEQPFPDDFFDAILVMHCLEFCQDELAVLNECNRILKDKGHILTIAANRRGAWSHREISPLAMGRPFSTGQLDRAYQKCAFKATQSALALYTPPTDRAWVQKYSETFEKLGTKLQAPMGGVILLEGQKDIHACLVIRSNETSKRFIRFTPAAINS